MILSFYEVQLETYRSLLSCFRLDFPFLGVLRFHYAVHKLRRFRTQFRLARRHHRRRQYPGFDSSAALRQAFGQSQIAFRQPKTFYRNRHDYFYDRFYGRLRLCFAWKKLFRSVYHMPYDLPCGYGGVSQPRIGACPRHKSRPFPFRG